MRRRAGRRLQDHAARRRSVRPAGPRLPVPGTRRRARSAQRAVPGLRGLRARHQDDRDVRPRPEVRRRQPRCEASVVLHAAVAARALLGVLPPRRRAPLHRDRPHPVPAGADRRVTPSARDRADGDDLHPRPLGDLHPGRARPGECPASIVEPVIALSISVVAGLHLWRIWRRGSHATDLETAGHGRFGLDAAGWARLAVVFCFGLVHGLGFASALGIDRAWSWTLLSSLLVFNVGIEFVQLGDHPGRLPVARPAAPPRTARRALGDRGDRRGCVRGGPGVVRRSAVFSSDMRARFSFDVHRHRTLTYGSRRWFHLFTPGCVGVWKRAPRPFVCIRRKARKRR